MITEQGSKTLTIAEQIAGQLRNELLAGQYEPGQPLREEQLARRFQVSRNPIRKVLSQLVIDGLLVAKPNCGVRVAQPASQNVRELLSPLRVQIECFALRAAFDVLAAENFRGLDPLLARLRIACEEVDPALILDRDYEFHQYFLHVAGLDEIIPIWRSIFSRLRDFHEQANHELGDYRVIPFVHEALVQVFRGGDLERSVIALTEHLLDGDFNLEQKARWRRLNSQALQGD